MLLTPHTIVGVAIASTVPNPFIAVPLSFFMHFMGDLVPHWDFYTHTSRENRVIGWRPLAVMADLAIGVAVGVAFTTYALWVLKSPPISLNVFLCGIASVLPDVLTGPSLYTSKPLKLFKIIHKIQSKLQTPANLPWGMISQIIIVAFCLLVISDSLIQ